MPGTCASKSATTTTTPAAVPPPAAAAATAADATMADAAAKKAVKVAIIYYSTYGHVAALARAVKRGIDAVDGVEGVLYQVPETLSPEILAKMHAPPKADDVPIATNDVLVEADGFVFGFPTRFGMMAAQMKAFFDATGGLWQKGALAGKAAGLFTSTASQGSGQETTILTAITQLAHHGMIYVPAGYGAGEAMFTLTEAKGGSPWGAGTFAGPTGARQPSDIELLQAEFQGKNVAGVVKKLAA